MLPTLRESEERLKDIPVRTSSALKLCTVNPTGASFSNAFLEKVKSNLRKSINGLCHAGQCNWVNQSNGGRRLGGIRIFTCGIIPNVADRCL